MKKINREFTIVEPEVLYEKGDRFFIFPKADSKLAKIIAPTVHLAEVREVFPYEGKYKMGWWCETEYIVTIVDSLNPSDIGSVVKISMQNCNASISQDRVSQDRGWFLSGEESGQEVNLILKKQ